MSTPQIRHSAGAPASQGGQFKAQQRSEAAVTLIGDPPIDIEDGDTHDIYVDDFQPIERISVRREGDKYFIEGTSGYNIGELAPAGVDTGEWLERNYAPVREFLHSRYGCHITDTDEDEFVVAEFFAETAGAPSEREAHDLLWDSTKATDLFNEYDNGTFGTENLDRLLGEWLDTQSVMAAYDANRPRTDERAIDFHIDAREGHTEVDDQYAAGIAQNLVARAAAEHPEIALPALTQLHQRGFADKEELRAELAQLFAVETPRYRRWTDMLQTWNIHGAPRD